MEEKKFFQSENTKIIKHGMCSWTDESLVKCGKFYPNNSKMNTIERLKVFANHFPCVEVDMSTYTIPSKLNCERWAQCTPPSFLFHFKAFQMFTHLSCEFSSLPSKIREKFSSTTSVVEDSFGKEKISWHELDPQLKDELWNAYNENIEPVISSNKLGCVLFQFQTGFIANEENRLHLSDCRRRLSNKCKMAVEFRSKTWLLEPELSRTVEFLTKNGICLACTDEPGLVPVVLRATSDFAYIRIHRRTGTNRILSETEMEIWAKRLLEFNFQGIIYMMWNTNHENQSVINSQILTKKIPHLTFNWKEKIGATPGTLSHLFSKAKKEEPKAETMNEEQEANKNHVETPPLLEPKQQPVSPLKRPLLSIKQSPKKQKMEQDPKQKGIQSFFQKK